MKIWGVMAGVMLAMPVMAGDMVYRWVDDRGKVVYSDVPPPGGRKVTRLSVSPSNGGVVRVPDLPRGAVAPPPAPVQITPEKPLASAPAGSIADDVKALNAKIADQNNRIRAENCKTVKTYLAMLERPVAPGTRVDPNREQSLAKARQDVTTWCAP